MCLLKLPGKDGRIKRALLCFALLSFLYRVEQSRFPSVRLTLPTRQAVGCVKLRGSHAQAAYVVCEELTQRRRPACVGRVDPLFPFRSQDKVRR